MSRSQRPILRRRHILPGSVVRVLCTRPIHTRRQPPPSRHAVCGVRVGFWGLHEPVQSSPRAGTALAGTAH
eukprot:567780-Rhodomonas_salina.1